MKNTQNIDFSLLVKICNYVLNVFPEIQQKKLEIKEKYTKRTIVIKEYKLKKKDLHYEIH